jgi:hypothetical protein
MTSSYLERYFGYKLGDTIVPQGAPGTYTLMDRRRTSSTAVECYVVEDGQTKVRHELYVHIDDPLCVRANITRGEGMEPLLVLPLPHIITEMERLRGIRRPYMDKMKEYAKEIGIHRTAIQDLLLKQKIAREEMKQALFADGAVDDTMMIRDVHIGMDNGHAEI